MFKTFFKKVNTKEIQFSNVISKKYGECCICVNDKTDQY